MDSIKYKSPCIGEIKIMGCDKDNVDELMLALLHLVMHHESEGGGRAWKGFDWDTMNHLYEKGSIGNPITHAPFTPPLYSLCQCH
jgi:hypothetical protein